MPKCMIQTPVGARFRDCVQLQKWPTYQVSIQHYLKAVGTGLGMAIGCGIIWGVIAGLVSSFYLNLLLAPAVGYAIGEVTSISVYRKRATALAAIAGIVVVSYVVGIFFPWGRSFPSHNMLYLILDLIAIALGVFVAVSRLH